jgi:hypothetical protein
MLAALNHKNMTLKIRRILFLICLLIFIASAPILVGYAFGYRYSLKDNRLIKTGAFLIKTKPSEVDIYLDGLLQDNKMMITPKGLIDKFVIITGLKPKNYLLEVKLENYYSWKKNLKIKEGLVTKANNIVLLPKNPEIFSLKDENENEEIENFFLSKNNLSQTDCQEKIISEIIGNQIFACAIFQNKIYYLEKPSGIIYKTDLSGKNKKQINSTSLESKNLSEETQLIISDEGKIAILNEHSLYLLNKNNQPILISENVKGAEFFPNSSNFLWFTPSEIYAWQLNIQLENGNEGNSQLITRYSKEIKKAVWTGDSNHIFFIVDKKIKFIETDDRDQRNVFDFIELKNENADLFYDSKNQKLYFLDEKIYWVDLKDSF